MTPTPRQGDLFSMDDSGDASGRVTSSRRQLADELIISGARLRDWQSRLHRHQAPLLQGHPQSGQTQLFGSTRPAELHARFSPLKLRALPLSFWRWPDSPHHGAAIYAVMDRPDHLPDPILLYIGETVAADRRWKGDHDCKTYLASYGEALTRAGLGSQPSIRFWGDVPADLKARRQLEQTLIQTWLPPFNKETRGRWATPFHAE